MAFKNFRIWRGRLPHWRADEVTYYVTFRHRRPLAEWERDALLKFLLRPEGRRMDVLIVAVLPEATEMIFRVRPSPDGEPYELADIIEKAKRQAGKVILKKTEERWPPFYEESYDRIIRDEAELAERWGAIHSSPVEHELAEDPTEYRTLWVSPQTEDSGDDIVP